MSERTDRLNIAWRSLLLGLLLLAQATAIAHEADHTAHGDSSVCAVCSIGSPLDGPIAADAAVSIPETADCTPPRTIDGVLRSFSSAPLAARAPPLHS